jgi:hypothetical protein
MAPQNWSVRNKEAKVLTFGSRLENMLEPYYESDEKYRFNKAKRHEINRSPHMTRGQKFIENPLHTKQVRDQEQRGENPKPPIPLSAKALPRLLRIT